MLDQKEVQAVIDDVLGNKKDPLRRIRDYLKQPEEEKKRVQRLEKKLAELETAKEECGDNWVLATSLLEKIEEAQRLTDQAKKECTAAVNETTDVISRVEDETQRKILMLRYIDLITDWQKIADETGISKAAARRMHTAALPDVKEIMAQMVEEKKDEYRR